MKLLNLLPPIQDDKVRNEWKGLIANARPVLDLISNKLKSSRDTAHKQFTSIQRHSDPGYPYSLTDHVGYIRALDEIINLIEEKDNV